MATLQDIQNGETELLKTFAELCDKHDIPYYLAGGTLLGAVRHKGFIPWDDDIDVNVRFEDLKKIRKIFIADLPKTRYYQNYIIDRKYHVVWDRLRDADKQFVRTREDGSQWQDNIWIDIIPLLKAANNPKWLKRQVRLLFGWSYCVRNQSNIFATKCSSMANKIYQIIREYFVYRLGGEILLGLAKALSSTKSGKRIVLDIYFFDNYSEEGFAKIKQIMVRDKWMKPAKYQFDGEMYDSFNDYDGYLTDHYGSDYMIPKKGRLHFEVE